MAQAEYLTVSTGQLITSSVNALSISSGTTYARTLSTTNVYADFIKGDGSQLSNVPFRPAAYSIPWNAMQQYGGLVIQSGDWYLQNVRASSLAVSSFFTASSINTNGITAIHGNIPSLTSRVISTFLISTNTLTVDTNFFDTQRGRIQIIESSIVEYLSAKTLTVANTNIDAITASLGRFSSISTGVWNVGSLAFSSFTLYDAAFNKDQVFAMSAGVLLIGGNNLLSNTVESSNLVSTTRDILFQLYSTSNVIDIRPQYSSLFSNVNRNFSITQSSVSSLSTTIGFTSNITFSTMSNLSVSISQNFNSLCNYTIASLNTASSITASNLSSLSNYTSTNFSTAAGALSSSVDAFNTRLSNDVIELICLIGATNSNTVHGLTTAISTVGFLTTSGISTSWLLLSTGTATTFSNTQAAISTSISNLSVATQSNVFTLSSLIGSTTSTLGGQLVSTISTFSTLITTNFVATQGGLSSLSTLNGNSSSTLNANLLSTISTFSTGIATNLTSIQSGFSTFSTVTSSNNSTLSAQLLSTISTFSTGIATNLTSIQSGFSTLSTVISSNTSTLNANLVSTISTFSTAIAANQSGLSSFSTIIGSNASTVSVSGQISTLSTTIGTLSNISLISFSTLSTSIGTTSNFLTGFSTFSTIIQSSFSTSYYVIQTGLSTLSTGISYVVAGINSNFSSLAIAASSISSGNVTARSVSTTSLFFATMGGSTMSSLTQFTGRLTTTQATTSSFSGNYGDAFTMVVQNL